VDLDGSVDLLETGVLAIHAAQAAQSFGLGATTKDLHIDGAELQRVTTKGGLKLGGSIGGDILVDGIVALESDYIYYPVSHVLAVVSLFAVQDDHQIVFDNTASTFNLLSVQADNGIHVKADVTTDVGFMYLDGDVENSSSADSDNKVSFFGARTLQVKTILTLEATTGSIVTDNALSLQSSHGMLILDDVTSTATGGDKPIYMNGDFDHDGDGVLTITTGKTVDSNNNPLILIAWDIDLAGVLNSGSSYTSVQQTQEDQSIGVGIAIDNALHETDLFISQDELARLTTGLNVGSTHGGDVRINGANVAFYLSIISGDDARIVFHTFGSTFSSIAAQADNGILVHADVTTTTGSMYLDGDSDDSSSADGFNDWVY
jgi:hypothetical protein